MAFRAVFRVAYGTGWEFVVQFLTGGIREVCACRGRCVFDAHRRKLWLWWDGQWSTQTVTWLEDGDTGEERHGHFIVLILT